MGSNKKKIFCLFIIACLSIFKLFAIDINLNNEKIKSYYSSEFLYNIYPPLYDVWEISVTYNNLENTTQSQEINIEEFNTIYLNKNSLTINNNKLNNIKDINISGEKIESTNLEVWIGWEGTDLLKEIITDWGKNNNIKINIINATNTASRLKTVNKSKTTPPDLVLVADSNLIDLYNDNTIQTLPKYLLNDVNSTIMNKLSFNGKYYASPFYYDVQLLFYNPNLIDLDKYDNLSLSNLEYEANKIKNKVEVPLTWNSYSLYWLLPFIYSFNINNSIDFDNDLSINNQPTYDAISYIKELNEKPYFKPLEKNAMLSYFINKKAAAILSASYSIPYFDQLGIYYEVAPLPINDITNQRLKPLIDSKVFVIPKGSHNTILSYRLLQYLMSYKIQKQFCLSQFKLSANETVEKEFEETNSYYKKILKNKEAFQLIPNNENYQTYKNILWKLLRFVFTDQLTVNEVIEKGEQLLINNKKEIGEEK